MPPRTLVRAFLTLLVYGAAVSFVRIHGVRGYTWGTIGAQP